MAENETPVVSDEPTSKAISQFPIKFDETVIPFFPGDWSRTANKSKNDMESEGGTRMVQIIRAKRLSLPFSMAIADDTWVGFFEGYSEKEKFNVSIYSPVTHQYETKVVEMVGFSAKPRKRSEKLTEVAGVWEVSFTLEEF